jgi:histidinol dehydrogenase
MRIMPLADFNPVKAFPDYQQDQGRIENIIRNVRENGDRALLDLTRTYDGVDLNSVETNLCLEKETSMRIAPELDTAIQEACGRIHKMAELQRSMFQDREWEIEPGVRAGQKIIPVQKAGIYVPGGRYPLISSLLMGCVPAQVAGVEEIVVCTPPGPEGKLHPALLRAAETAGVDRIFRVGGAQAIAGMAYGTESIPAVDFIAGPGNIYVNIAKKMVCGQVGIDFIAGPTEILVIADAEAEPEWIAADLIAQAEHDENARPVMLTNSPELALKVKAEVLRLLNGRKTKETAAKALKKNGCILLTGSIEKAVTAANQMAPEHLQLNVREPEKWMDKCKNYGTLFLGGYACEVLGDYSSGLNHVLPTNRAARYSGGLSVRNFLKIQTVLKLDEEGFRNISRAALHLAEAEGLDGHAFSIKVRLNHLKRPQSR